MNIHLFLLSVQLLVVAIDYSRCDRMDISNQVRCDNACYDYKVTARSNEACATCCKNSKPKYKTSIKGYCRKGQVVKVIFCYCNIPVKVKAVPSCKAECKDMPLFGYERENSCATCCKKFNKSAAVKAECKRGFMDKADSCYCTFDTPAVAKRATTQRNIGVRLNNRRGVLPFGRSSSNNFPGR